MKKILVPCDFSEPAVQAFRFAVDIAKASRGEIFLLNVIELPTLYDSSAVLAFEATYMQERKTEAEGNFKRLVEKWSGDGMKVRTIVEFGGLLSTIRDTTKKVKADLVVVGTHGAGGLREYTVGSNTEKLVRTIDIPVIAVKKSPKAIRNIVFPTTPDMEMEGLTMKVKELQNFFKATIHVLFVNTPAIFKRDMVTKPALEAFAKRFMLKDYTLNIYNDISEEEGIINFSKAIKADIVAMRTHGRRGLAHIATGSIAEDVVNHIECPIWTLRIR